MRRGRAITARRRWLAVGLSAVALAAIQVGCDVGSARAGGGHAHAGSNQGGGAHGGGHETAAHSQTVYDSGLELFVEYPSLVAGREAEFSAHVSTVDGYEPADAGTVAIVLTGESAPGERFESDEPIRGGLYQPIVEPDRATGRRLLISYRGPEGNAIFSLGDVQVHESPGEHAPSGEPAGGDIAFSKEQQWKVDFATGRVARRSLQPSVRARAFVRPTPDAEIRVRAPFAGRIREPDGGFPGVGQPVEAGQTVAAIAPSVDADVLPSLRTDISGAETELERRQREVERLKGLADSGAVPTKRLLDARSRLEAARADLEAARRRLRQYESLVDDDRTAAISLRAPTAGRVTERAVAAGEYVERGALVLRTVDLRRLRLEVRVAEANLPIADRVGGVWFERETGEIVELDRTSERSFARVDRIDPETRTRSFWFGLPAGADGLVPGQFHRAQLETGATRDSLAVPTTALIEEKGVWTAYVVRGGDSFERRRVEIGLRDGDHVEIVDGLESGDRVVTRGAYYVKLASATTGVGSHSH